MLIEINDSEGRPLSNIKIWVDNEAYVRDVLIEIQQLGLKLTVEQREE